MKKRFTEEQIIGFLKQAEAGIPVKELCRTHGFSDASFYTWRAKYGGMTVPDAKRLKELEAENAKLKRLLAESILDTEALKVALGPKALSCSNPVPPTIILAPSERHARTRSLPGRRVGSPTYPRYTNTFWCGWSARQWSAISGSAAMNTLGLRNPGWFRR